MLKQRIITALVLVIVLMAALFSEQLIYWRLLINLAILVGFWEWVKLSQLKGVVNQCIAYILFIAAVVALQFGCLPLSYIVPISCLIWMVLFVFTLTDELNFLHQEWIKIFIGIVVLSVAGVLIIDLKNLNNGPLWVLCFLVSVWAADIGAYFIGRRFGKTKLAPKVSPGKTVEGLFGGVVFALIIFIPISLIWFEEHQTGLLLTIIVTVLVSVVGDLFESKQKRFAGIKDSSQVLPGHGGVLDRIDSLLSGAPFFVMGLIVLGYWR